MININAAVKLRYSIEANDDSNLSCGNNLQFAKLNRGEKVLDLGCGRGKETFTAAKTVAPEGKAVGLDLTEEMLSAARNAALENNVANVDFILGDISNLPFEDASFDVVLSNCVINHANDKLKVYQEIHRVLNDNGRLLISDIVALEELPPEIRNDEKAWANCFAGAENKDFYFQTIAAAGFASIEILRWREYKKEGYLIASVTFNAFKI